MRVELPPEPVHFVNREDERERALRAVEEWRGRSRPLVLSLTGPGGLGKTELAFLLARNLRDRFPDGVLTVDLDDYRTGGELDPGEVLAQLLDSLDVPPDLLERQFRARCRQYWKKTADSRLIVVVDNARYASEVVPLLPASGGSLVVVASHGPLYDLEDGAAVDMALPALTDPAATELLELIVRDQRLAADPEAARTMVRLCHGLPAALHVAGRWVRAHRVRPLDRLVADLRSELDEKGVSPGVERVWDTAYRGLSGPAAALYRLLPAHPGPTFTTESATALLGRGPGTGQDVLEELHRAGLLELAPSGGEKRAGCVCPAHCTHTPGGAPAKTTCGASRPRHGHEWCAGTYDRPSSRTGTRPARVWSSRTSSIPCPAHRTCRWRTPHRPSIPPSGPGAPSVPPAGCTPNATRCTRACAWPMDRGWTPRPWPCASPCGRTRWTTPTSPM
ncbi:AAA family ATPase [Streptomyces sp. NPDC001750]|uniref:AAA family ATPase n=1 Tax=Streptomyces sp. NPDC001750 TaxID=3364607 RepID=UPI0036D1A397